VTIEAAGGILWRPAEGAVEVLLVHRPAYGDWTFPKGKPHEGEEPHETALREVWEETGLTCRITSDAGMIHYVTGGQDKLVRYWAMQPADGEFRPNREVDEVRWLPLSEALDQLSYRHDRELLASLDVPRWARVSTVYLVRHGHAGEKSAWIGDDRLRPLSPTGEAQAQDLVPLLRFTGIQHLISSPHLRCVQTLEPLASELGLKIEEHPGLAEGAPDEMLDALLEGANGQTVVLCSHGDVIPRVLDRLSAEGVEIVGDDAKKGSIWVLAAVDGRFRSATYVPPATT
jgi:8-oxo-dGTP pyrophosphatase MutT (NUDIX family)/broad specificity phosphatase PhoE